jgi:hypothetical protein
MTSPTIEWFYPITGFLVSGWFVAAYFAFMPGYTKMLVEAHADSVINVVSPNMYLVMAIIINVVSWMAALRLQPQKEVPAT